MGETTTKNQTNSTTLLLNMFFFLKKITLISAKRVLNVTFFSCDFLFIPEPDPIDSVGVFRGTPGIWRCCQGRKRHWESCWKLWRRSGQWGGVSCELSTTMGRCFSINGDVCFPNKNGPNQKMIVFRKPENGNPWLLGKPNHFRTPDTS